MMYFFGLVVTVFIRVNVLWLRFMVCLWLVLGLQLESGSGLELRIWLIFTVLLSVMIRFRVRD